MMRTSLMIFAALACLHVSLAFPHASNSICDPKYDHPDDCAALADLYHAADGTGRKTNGTNTGYATWLSGKSICVDGWCGVRCSMPGRLGQSKRAACADTVCCLIPNPTDKCPKWARIDIKPKNCRVDSIDLSINNLVGTIPESISKLGFITKLDLSDNKLTGAVPTSLGQSSSLTFLRLNNNALTSWRPNICPQLQLVPTDGHPHGKIDYCTLMINTNNLACPIPECLKKYCKATCKSNEAEAP